MRGNNLAYAATLGMNNEHFPTYTLFVEFAWHAYFEHLSLPSGMLTSQTKFYRREISFRML